MSLQQELCGQCPACSSLDLFSFSLLRTAADGACSREYGRCIFHALFLAFFIMRLE